MSTLDTPYDIACKQKYWELSEKEPREPGYSPAQLFSVMVVMECDRTEAMKLIDQHAHGLDWSEASWGEMRDYFLLMSSED